MAGAEGVLAIVDLISTGDLDCNGEVDLELTGEVASERKQYS
jgi:hypothetical protein